MSIGIEQIPKFITYQDPYKNWFVNYDPLLDIDIDVTTSHEEKKIELIKSFVNTINGLDGDQAIIVKNVSPNVVDEYNVLSTQKAVLMGTFDKILYYLIRRKSNCPEIFDRDIKKDTNLLSLNNPSGYSYAAGFSIIVNHEHKLYGLYHKDRTRPIETCPGGCTTRVEWLDCLTGKTTPESFYFNIAFREVEEESSDCKNNGLKLDKSSSHRLCNIGFKQKYFGVENIDDTYALFGTILDTSQSHDPYLDKLFDASNYCSVSHTYTLKHDDYETEYVCARELMLPDPDIKFYNLYEMIEWIKVNQYPINNKAIRVSMIAQIGHYLNLVEHNNPSFNNSIKGFEKGTYLDKTLKDFGFPPQAISFTRL